MFGHGQTDADPDEAARAKALRGIGGKCGAAFKTYLIVLHPGKCLATVAFCIQNAARFEQDILHPSGSIMARRAGDQWINAISAGDWAAESIEHPGRDTSRAGVRFRPGRWRGPCGGKWRSGSLLIPPARHKIGPAPDRAFATLAPGSGTSHNSALRSARNKSSDR